MVTAKDWSQMLLHESFAQFFMYKAVREMTKSEQDRQLIVSYFTALHIFLFRTPHLLTSVKAVYKKWTGSGIL
jgi:aminopeptidase N